MHGPLHYLVTTELVRSIPRISHAAEEERDPLKRHEYVPQSAEEIAAMPIDELRIVAEWRHHFRSTCRCDTHGPCRFTYPCTFSYAILENL